MPQVLIPAAPFADADFVDAYFEDVLDAPAFAGTRLVPHASFRADRVQVPLPAHEGATPEEHWPRTGTRPIATYTPKRVFEDLLKKSRS